jgi:hypothetical protein
MELRADMKTALPRIERIEQMLERLPTWGKLGGAALSVGGLILAALKLF